MVVGYEDADPSGASGHEDFLTHLRLARQPIGPLRSTPKSHRQTLLSVPCGVDPQPAPCQVTWNISEMNS
jgi:hypothetical protein